MPTRKTKNNTSQKKKNDTKKSNKKVVEESWIVSTQREVAKAFDVSTRTIAHWINDGMPVTDDNNYDLMQIKNWKIERDSKSNKFSDDGDLFKDAEQWEIRFRKARAERHELELAEKRGELVSRIAAEKAISDRILTVKRQFLSIPKQLSPQLVGLDANDIEHILNSRIEEIIEGFSVGKF